MTQLETRDNLKTLEAEWMKARDARMIMQMEYAASSCPSPPWGMSAARNLERQTSMAFHDAIDALIDGAECITLGKILPHVHPTHVYVTPEEESRERIKSLEAAWMKAKEERSPDEADAEFAFWHAFDTAHRKKWCQIWNNGRAGKTPMPFDFPPDSGFDAIYIDKPESKTVTIRDRWSIAAFMRGIGHGFRFAADLFDKDGS